MKSTLSGDFLRACVSFLYSCFVHVLSLVLLFVVVISY